MIVADRSAYQKNIESDIFSRTRGDSLPIPMTSPLFWQMRPKINITTHNGGINNLNSNHLQRLETWNY